MADLIGQRLGQYEIVALLGKGGMAAVYRARQVNMKRDVAIKVIESEQASASEFVRRFEREVETIASLSHAHILKVFDYGQHEGTVYLVMELLAGGNLADLIRQGPVPGERVSQLLGQITSALDYAHQRGIVHRDLKPQNVMLDEAGNAFLTDFGIAKILSGEHVATMTQAGAIMGTPAYMAPEQWKSEPVDARTDVYALGIMLFEMLAGELPFNADTAFGMMHKHVNEPPPVEKIAPRFPSGVERVLNRALAKDPARRYSSAGELASAFNAALAGRRLTDTGNLVPEPAGGEALKLTLIDVPPEEGEADTAILVDKAAAPTPPPPDTSGAARSPKAESRPALPVVGVAVAALVLVVAVVALLAGGGGAAPTQTPTPTTAATQAIAVVATETITPPATSTPSTTPSTTPSATPSATLTGTNTSEPEPLTQVALTLTGRVTQTAVAVASFTRTPTPDRQATAAALIAASDTASARTSTAIAVASFTKTLTPTPTFTATPTATRTPSHTPSPTLTRTPTATPTLTRTPTATPTPTLTPSHTPGFATAIALAATQGQICTVSADNPFVSVHKGPGRNRVVLRFMPVDTPVRVLDQRRGEDSALWWQVDLNGLEDAWVRQNDVTASDACRLAAGVPVVSLPTQAATLSPAPTGTATRTPTGTLTHTPTGTPTRTATASAGTQTAVAAAPCTVSTTRIDVTVHKGPGRNRVVLRFFPADQPVRVLGQGRADDNTLWWEIDLEGLEDAWVAQRDVSAAGACAQFVTPSATPVTPTVSADLCTVSTTRIDVRVHRGPGRNRVVLRFFPANQPVRVLGQGRADDNTLWWEIDLEGLEDAWVAQADVIASAACRAISSVPASPTRDPTAMPTASTTPSPLPSPTFTLTLTATPTATWTSARTTTPTRTPTRTRTFTLTMTATGTRAVALAGAEGEACTVSTANTSVTVHKGPGRNRVVLRFFPANEPVKVLAQAEASDGSLWWLVELGGLADAWVAQADVESSGPCDQVGTPEVPTPTPSATPSGSCTVSTGRADVTVHKGPGRNRVVLRFLPANEPVKVLAQAEASDGSLWWQVDLEGLADAWVAQADVESSGPCDQIGTPESHTLTPSATPGGPCTVSTERVNVTVHMGPGRNRGVLRFFPAGQPVPVLAQARASDASAWWKVALEGVANGWVAQADVTAVGDCEAIPEPSATPAK